MMSYKRDHVFYLYKSKAYREGAPITEVVNYHLKHRTWPMEYQIGGPEDGMDSFDAQGCKQRLDSLIPESIIVRSYAESSFGNGRGILSVYTDVDNAVELLKYLRFFAGLYELVVYDPQTDRSYYHTDRDLEEYVTATIRENELISRIRESDKHYIITKIGDEREINNTVISYSVTLIKTIVNGFEREVGKFDNLLKDLLISGDNLIYANDCFAIENEHLTIQFVFEGYKNAQYIGCIKDGQIFVRNLNRMGCHDASKIGYVRQEVIYGLMKAEELKGKYPNPGDRFVYICKTKDYLKKKLTCVKYEPYPIYGGYVLLNRTVSEYNIRKYHSEVGAYLMIDWDIFEVIVPCFEKYYPHLSSRFSEDNYIPDLTTKDIIEEIKNRKRLIVSSANSDVVKNLFEETYIPYEQYSDKEYIKMLLGAIDFLCEWLEMNLEAGDDYMINITS